MKNEEWKKYKTKETEKAAREEQHMWKEAERLRRASSGVRGILKTKAPPILPQTSVPPQTAASSISSRSLKPPNTALLRGMYP